MLVLNLVSYDEQTIAETVRGVASRCMADHGISKQSVDEAIRHFRSLPPKLRNVHASTRVGIEFLNQLRVQQARGLVHVVHASAPPHPESPDKPFAWVESWPVITLWLLLAAALIAMAAAGALA